MSKHSERCSIPGDVVFSDLFEINWLQLVRAYLFISDIDGNLNGKKTIICVLLYVAGKAFNCIKVSCSCGIHFLIIVRMDNF